MKEKDIWKAIIIPIIVLFVFSLLHRYESSRYEGRPQWEYVFENDTLMIGLSLNRSSDSNLIDFTMLYENGPVAYCIEGDAELFRSQIRFDDSYIYLSDELNISLGFADSTESTISFSIDHSIPKGLHADDLIMHRNTLKAAVLPLPF